VNELLISKTQIPNRKIQIPKKLYKFFFRVNGILTLELALGIFKYGHLSRLQEKIT
jgi:hypothetical protein